MIAAITIAAVLLITDIAALTAVTAVPRGSHHQGATR
jgi:hypothetical protein